MKKIVLLISVFALMQTVLYSQLLTPETVPTELKTHKVENTHIYSKDYKADFEFSFDSIVVSSWNDLYSDLRNQYKEEFIYNSAGKLTERRYFIYSENFEKWMLNTLVLSEYDEKNRLVSEVMLTWSTTEMQMVNSTKYTIVYDDNDNIIKTSSYYWKEEYQDYFKVYSYEYTYDENNRVLTQMYLYYDINSGIVNSGSKYLYEYDINGNLITRTDMFWDTYSSNWKNMYKGVSVYNAENLIIDNLNYSWDNINEIWVGSNRTSYGYNMNGLYNLFIYYNWNTVIENWQENYKTTYLYYLGTNLLHFITNFSWDSGMSAWVNSTQSENIFDGEMRVIESYYKYWDSSISNWISTQKTEYAYDDKDQKILEASYYWDNVLLIWMGNYMSEYNYDLNSNIIFNRSSFYDYALNDWVWSNKTHYVYDDKNNLTDMHTFNWNSIDEIWIDYYRNMYEYDILNSIDDIAAPPWYFSYFYYGNSMLLNAHFYNIVDNVFRLSSSSQYFYSDFHSNINEELTSNSLEIYPNPCSENIFLSLDTEELMLEMSIWDINGRVLYNEIIDNNSIVSIKDLATGMYLLKISDGDKEFNEKLIKK